jgi:hypothetical protein
MFMAKIMISSPQEDVRIQKHSSSWRIIPMILFLLATLWASCANETLGPETFSGVFESCEGFTDTGMIEDMTETSGLILRVRVLEIDSIPGLAESGAVNNCLVEVFRTLDGDNEPAQGNSLSLSLVRFETSEQPLLLYNSALASALITTDQMGDLARIQQEVLGPDSYLMNVKNGGIGALVVYVSGPVFVSMSSTTDSRGNTLADEEQLLDVAHNVQSRLP